ncbi:MAG: hypothetical protein C0518_08310 [Opitutus sp.]|nr:hypothetical protein [Opitutus sp.]
MTATELTGPARPHAGSALMILRLFRYFCLCGFLSGATLCSATTDEQRERLAIAHLLACGRLPATDETAVVPADEASVATLLAQHRRRWRDDSSARVNVARRAWRDAFGRNPTASELAAEEAAPLTYAERLQHHLRRLAADAAVSREVLHRAYRAAVQREAYAEEIRYWQPHGALPFVVLVGCIEDWAQRNQPGLMVTTGVPAISVNSRLLVTRALPPDLAAEVRAVLFPERIDAVSSGRLLTAGGEKIATRGGMHLVIAGRADFGGSD